MITRINLENLKIEKWVVRKVDLKFDNNGLKIVTPNECKFLIYFLDYVEGRGRLGVKRFFEITANDKTDLSYITIHCDYQDETLKYISTYDNGKIFSEIIKLGNNLVAGLDYTEDELTKGVLYWDTLGGPDNFKNISGLDAILLTNTMAGKRLIQELGSYVLCDFTPDMSLGAIMGRMCYGGKNRIPELNKLYPMFGFNLTIDENFEVHPGGSKYGISVTQEGSGFHHLLEIFTKLMYCKENNLTLIIPEYDETLNPKPRLRLKEYLESSGVNIIASSYKE